MWLATNFIAIAKVGLLTNGRISQLLRTDSRRNKANTGKGSFRFMCLVHFKINSQWWTFHYHSTYTFVFALDVQIYLLKIKSNDSSLVFELRFCPLVRRELFGHFWQEKKDSSKKKAFYFLFHLKASMRTLNDVIYMYVSHFHQRDLLRFTYQNKIIIVITCLEVVLLQVLFSVIAYNFHKESAQKWHQWKKD